MGGRPGVRSPGCKGKSLRFGPWRPAHQPRGLGGHGTFSPLGGTRNQPCLTGCAASRRGQAGKPSALCLGRTSSAGVIDPRGQPAGQHLPSRVSLPGSAGWDPRAEAPLGGRSPHRQPLL